MTILYGLPHQLISETINLTTFCSRMFLVFLLNCCITCLRVHEIVTYVLGGGFCVLQFSKEKYLLESPPEKLRKELEEELKLSSSDMRSHGWYHGHIPREVCFATFADLYAARIIF